MVIKNNVPLQEVSWVKSDESLKDVHASSAAHLYYPENMDELIELCRGFYRRGEAFDLIGYASNTLLLPSYHPRHLICTRKLEEMVEDDICIMCECGVQVRQLAKFCVAHGYERLSMAMQVAMAVMSPHASATWRFSVRMARYGC